MAKKSKPPKVKPTIIGGAAGSKAALGRSISILGSMMPAVGPVMAKAVKRKGQGK